MYSATILLQLTSLIINFLLINNFGTANQDCVSFKDTCNKQTHCQDCLSAHHCCVWCYSKHFEDRRCSVKDFSKCDQNHTVFNSPGNVNITANESFRDVHLASEAIQFQPQGYEVNLRLGEPKNITIKYKPAKNFFLDLYYLMDLTKSMQPDLNTLTQLGLNLTQLLQNLTANHKIAFGSYVDKPTSPFYSTAGSEYDNPCLMEEGTCEKGYLFKHNLNFTNNIKEFTKKVKESDVSANLDNLEGGFDALMQILLCGRKIGWSENSRKFVVVATDGKMHLAGDGLLSGSVKRNRHKCLIDTDGDYTFPLLYDYPSLEELYAELKHKKTNMIIAAKNTTLDYYKKMRDEIPGVAHLGELKNESTNILELVKEGYYAFMKQVTLSMNTSMVEELGVEFFANCYGGDNWTRISSCDNAEEGKIIDFKIQLFLHRCPNSKSIVTYIEESKINEKIEVKINFVGCHCNCPNTVAKKCVHGTSDCEGCKCDEGWQGERCETHCENNWNNCRYEENGELSLACSSRGECICSKCVCHKPFQGDFCQFECPYDRARNLFCGGHGDCMNGTCSCHDMYEGVDCGCQKSQENCKVPGYDSLCNGNGTCECNQCKCNPGYSGRFCENCDQCEGLCSNYENCVIVHINKTLGTNNQSCNNEAVRVEEVSTTEEQCLYRYDKGNEKCDAYYTYTINHDRSVNIKLQAPKCYTPVKAGFVVTVIIAVILAAGILAILIWKARNVYRDKIEYQQFIRDQERNRHSELNPLYKSPVTSYDLELMNLHPKSQ